MEVGRAGNEALVSEERLTHLKVAAVGGHEFFLALLAVFNIQHHPP